MFAVAHEICLVDFQHAFEVAEKFLGVVEFAAISRLRLWFDVCLVEVFRYRVAEGLLCALAEARAAALAISP